MLPDHKYSIGYVVGGAMAAGLVAYGCAPASAFGLVVAVSIMDAVVRSAVGKRQKK